MQKLFASVHIHVSLTISPSNPRPYTQCRDLHPYETPDIPQEAEEPNLTIVNIKMFDLYRALVLCYPIFLFTRRLSSAGNVFSSLRKPNG